MSDVDRTRLAVRRQLAAMGAETFAVALGRDDGSKVWRVESEAATLAEVLAELPALRRANARGWGVHVRPLEPHGLVFVDDVDLATWQRMIEQGYAPAVVIQSSPHNYQLWLRHPAPLDPVDRGLLAAWLARRAGADASGVAESHWGRLAGFTNRKPEYRGKSGLYRYVLLERAGGAVYDQAERVLAEVLPRLRAQMAPRRQGAGARLGRADLRPLAWFHESERYGGDLHRADLAWARHARGCGLSEEEIDETIRRGRDLSHKGAVYRQDDYAERTARKVFET